MMDTTPSSLAIDNFSGVSVQETDLWFALYELPYREAQRAIETFWEYDDPNVPTDVGMWEEMDIASDQLWYDYEHERDWWGDVVQVMVEEINR